MLQFERLTSSVALHWIKNVAPCTAYRLLRGFAVRFCLVACVCGLSLRELLLQTAIVDDGLPGQRLAHHFAGVAELGFVGCHEQKRIAQSTLRCAATHQGI